VEHLRSAIKEMTMAATVRKNERARRYELLVDGELGGYAEYNVLQNAILFTHAEVFPKYEGLGYSSVLVKATLDDVRAMGTHAIPVCQVVAGYIRRHPEYRDLLAPDVRHAFP
jgi:hypothetical protein